MLAMYMNSVSIGYGSPFQALRINRCIRPCAAIGASHENALSMRAGRPVVVEDQILGPQRIAERRAGQRLAGDDLLRACRPASDPAGPASDTAICSASRPAHRSCRSGSAAGAARGRSGTRSNGPRCRASHAPRPDGRASSRDAGRPSRSTALRSRSPARRRRGRSRRRGERMRAAGMPQIAATASGAYCGSR